MNKFICSPFYSHLKKRNNNMSQVWGKCLFPERVDMGQWVCTDSAALLPGAWVGVLVYSGYYDKISQARCLRNTRNVLITVLEAGSPRTRCQQIQCLVRAHFLFIESHILAVSSHGRREQGALWISYIGTLIPFMKALLSWPNYLLKPSPPNTITMAIRFQHMNLRGTQALGL